MNFGMFKFVCQFLLNFMNLLHSWLHDYGLAILALTTIIKLTLWPLQNKANRSMRQMAALSPKMQELKEKYKDDPTRMNQEVMKLYKQYGINPVGGCLPMMIQIPIFFGLFTMLGQAVELRNAKFLWVKDLSQPDTLFVIPGMGWIPILGIPGVGLPINILPILMGATQVWLMAHDAEDRRPHAAPSDDVHAAYLLVFLLQFRGGAGIVLHYSKSFQHLAILSEQKPTHAEARKSCAGRKTKTMMTPKELLDTMLGYLGFVVQIEETKNEGGNLGAADLYRGKPPPDRARWRDARGNSVFVKSVAASQRQGC